MWKFRKKKFDSSEVKIEPKNLKDKTENFGCRASRDCKMTVIGKKHGIPVSYVPPLNGFEDINILATLNSAVLRGFPIEIRNEDIRVNVRKARAPRITAILLDSSGSMGLQKRISIAKGIAKKLVERSYQRRDWLSLIVFRGNEAELIVKPTKRYEKIFDAIESLPTGGKTPLPSALLKLISISNHVKNAHCRGILITDGKANVPVFGKVDDDLAQICSLIVKKGIKLEIYDTRSKVFDPAPNYIEMISEITKAEVHKDN